MELETPPKYVPKAPAPELTAKNRHSFVWCWTLGLFLALWGGLYALNIGLPYLKNGSDLVFAAKLRFEQAGQVFPADPSVMRVLIFGNSKILAGFLPSVFDQMAASEKLSVSSYNSGFPGSDVFLPQLKEMCERGQAPDVLLLTLPWKIDPKRNIFHLVPDDHVVIEEMFPFRFWLRDSVSFLMSARGHGGIRSFYAESKTDEQKVIVDRGYFEITEQSRFAEERLPDNFHLASDQPNVVVRRQAPAVSPQIDELNGLIRKYSIRCYYLPYYMRIGESAPAEARDQSFAAVVEKATPCRLLGPDYLLYPNRLFSDQTHLNTAGAREYTAALFGLVEDELRQGNKRALQ